MPVARRQTPLYLARGTYRQRRLRDAARVLPIAGAVLWTLPLIAAKPLTSTTGLYLFGVWLLMICIAAAIASCLELDVEDAAPDDPQSPADD